jgi:hypothetical protein
MLRWRLTLPAAAVALGLGVTLTAIGFWDAHRIVSATGDQLVRHFAGDVSDDLGEFLGRSNRVLSRIEHEIARNAIPLNDPRAVLRELYAVLTDEPRIDWLFFANDAGGDVAAGRLEDGATVFLMTDDFRAGILRQFDASPDGQPGKLRKSSAPFDARRKTWYKRATETRGRYWTEPYLGSSEPVLGISLVAPVFGDGGRFDGVIGTDLIFTSFVNRLQSRPLGNTGRVFVMDAAGQLIAASGAVPAVKTDANGEQRRVAAVDAPDPVVRETARYLLAQPGFPGQWPANGVQSIVFWSPTLRETYAAASMFHVPGDVAWTLVATIPASDLLGPTERTVLISFGISLAVVALTVFLGYWLVGRTLRPLGALTQAAQSIARGMARCARDAAQR